MTEKEEWTVRVSAEQRGRLRAHVWRRDGGLRSVICAACGVMREYAPTYCELIPRDGWARPDLALGGARVE